MYKIIASFLPDIDKIEEAEEEVMKKDVSSPLKKRKRAARRVLDSDSDSDFGAEDKIPRYPLYFLFYHQDSINRKCNHLNNLAVLNIAYLLGVLLPLGS